MWRRIDEELKKRLDVMASDDLTKVSWWCEVPEVRTVGDLLSKENLSVFEGSQDIWEEKFEKWKDTPEIIKAIKDSNLIVNADFSENTDKANAGFKVKKWCEDSKSRRFSEEGVYDSLYSQIRGVCTNYSDRK